MQQHPLDRSKPPRLNALAARSISLPLPITGTYQYQSASKARLIRAQAEERRLKLKRYKDLEWYDQTEIIASCDQHELRHEREGIERRCHGGRIISAHWRQRQEVQDSEIDQARRDLMTTQSASSRSRSRVSTASLEPDRAGDDSRPAKTTTKV